MYKNNFLTNYSKNKFIDEIKRALTNCMSFSLSVSFIKKAGLILIEKEIEEARKTFQKVSRAKRSYGLYIGNSNNIDCDFIFASNIMMANHLNDFLPNEFDYIVIDECHHSVASSYKKIIEYFKRSFCLV